MLTELKEKIRKHKPSEVYYLRRVIQTRLDYTAPDELFQNGLYRAAGPAILWIAVRDELPLWPIRGLHGRDACDLVDLYDEKFFLLKGLSFFELWVPALLPGHSSGFLRLRLHNYFQKNMISLERSDLVIRASDTLTLTCSNLGRRRRSDPRIEVHDPMNRYRPVYTSHRDGIHSKQLEIVYPGNHINRCSLSPESVRTLQSVLEQDVRELCSLYCSSVRIRLSAKPALSEK